MNLFDLGLENVLKHREDLADLPVDQPGIKSNTPVLTGGVGCTYETKHIKWPRVSSVRLGCR